MSYGGRQRPNLIESQSQRPKSGYRFFSQRSAESSKRTTGLGMGNDDLCSM